MFTTSFPGDNSHLKGQTSPWLKHFPGLEELIIGCKACLQGQHVPLNLGRSDPSIPPPPPPQQTWSCRWFCHRGVVVFLALIQNRCREGGFGHPPAPAAHVLHNTWINPFPACSMAKLSSQAATNQITNFLFALFLCMCLLLCLMFALRNKQEQRNSRNSWPRLLFVCRGLQIPPSTWNGQKVCKKNIPGVA